MFGFLKQVGDYTRDAVSASKNIAQGLSVTFDHLRRRPITVQYPYEKLIPSERYRGRIHFEFDKCIACEVCVRVCPINLPVVDWVMNTKWPHLIAIASITTTWPLAGCPPALPATRRCKPLGNWPTCPKVKWIPMEWIQAAPGQANYRLNC